MAPPPQSLLYPQQQCHPKQLHMIDGLLGYLKQRDVKDHEASAAAQRLVQLFSSKRDTSNVPTPARLEALVCLLTGGTTAAAAAGANILSSICISDTSIASYLVQHGAVLTAIARLLQSSGQAAQAAAHLLLALAGQSPGVRFEAPACHPDDFQCAMSHDGVLDGLLHQLASGSDSAAEAAVLLLARHSDGSSRAAVAAQLIAQHTALFDVVAFLVRPTSSSILVNAAVQLLCTLAETGCEGAKVVAEADQAVTGLLRLLHGHNKAPPQQWQQAGLTADIAACRAACALSHIVSNAAASGCLRVPTYGYAVTALVESLQCTDNVALQERALHVLCAAARKGGEKMCSLILSQPCLVAGLVHLLPGGAHPLEAAQELAADLAANVTSHTAVQLAISLIDAITGMQSAAVKSSLSAAAEQAAWILINLPSAARLEEHEQLPLADAVAPLLALADSEAHPELDMFRDAAASKLSTIAGDASGAQKIREAAAAALCTLIRSVDAAERPSAATCKDAVCGLGRYLESCNKHGSPHTSHIANGLGAGAATSALLKLAAQRQIQAAPLVAPASMQDGSDSSLQTWLAANSEVLQQVAAAGWGRLSVSQLAAVAQKARVLQADERLREQQQPVLRQHRPKLERQPVSSQAYQQQPLTGGKAASAAAYGEPDATGSQKQDVKQQSRGLVLPPSSSLPIKKQDTAGNAPPSHSDDKKPSLAEQKASIAVSGTKQLAGLAGSCSQAPYSSSPATALVRATQTLIQEASGSTPLEQQLTAKQVALQPFDAQQLQALCAAYMRCNFRAVSLTPTVRSQELVPLLRRLHTQAQAEQQVVFWDGSTAAVETIKPTPAAVKLLRALRLLQHWDIVCPTQPRMPEPLRKMMQQAGCAASGDTNDDDEDVQLVDNGPAAEVDADVDARLQQLEDGGCDLVLVKYVPGRHEQPDVQLIDQVVP